MREEKLRAGRERGSMQTRKEVGNKGFCHVWAREIREQY